MGKGVFVSFEGIDGSGKTEQAFRLSHWLFSRSKKFTSVLVTREPTAGLSGRKLRKLLKQEKNPFSRAEEFLKLYVKDRREHWRGEIKPALARGDIVVADRFKHSSMAFQQTQGISLSHIVALHKGIPSPDLTILIDVPAEEAYRRIGRRGLEGNEKFEQLAFMQRLRETYLQLPNQLPRDNIVVVNGNGSREQVFERVKGAAVKSGLFGQLL